MWLSSLFLFYNNARYQLVMDRVNAQMVRFVSEELPINGVVFVNLPADNEYVEEIQYNLAQFYNRPDIQVS